MPDRNDRWHDGLGEHPGDALIAKIGRWPVAKARRIYDALHGQAIDHQGKKLTLVAGADSGLVNPNNVLIGKYQAILLKLVQSAQQRPGYGDKNMATIVQHGKGLWLFPMTRQSDRSCWLILPDWQQLQSYRKMDGARLLPKRKRISILGKERSEHTTDLGVTLRRVDTIPPFFLFPKGLAKGN